MELGNFTKHENGNIAGTVTTLLTSFDLEFREIGKVGNGPDYRVYRLGTNIEVGMAHIKYGGHSGKQYLNTLIDTPEFSRGLWLALVQEEDNRYVMKWSRPRKGNQAKPSQGSPSEATAANA